jgi:hypothetical protein
MLTMCLVSFCFSVIAIRNTVFISQVVFSRMISFGFSQSYLNAQRFEFGLARLDESSFVIRRQFAVDVLLHELLTSLAMTLDELRLRRKDVVRAFAERAARGVSMCIVVGRRLRAKRLETPATEARSAPLARQRNALVVAVVVERQATVGVRTAQREQPLDDHTPMPIGVASHRARQLPLVLATNR